MDIVEAPQSEFLVTSAKLFNDNREVASSAWAYDKMSPNKYFKWILANFVEADNPNRNKHYWSLDSLKESKYSIDNSPLNMNHKANNIVGSIVASEMQYPLNDRASSGLSNPYVEVLGNVWKFYFEDELREIEKAYDAGALFISMECVSDSINCSECHGNYEYKGPIHPSYCNHINNRDSNLEFQGPHFLGGGVITPPNVPGWQNAHINEIAKVTDEEADKSLAALQAMSPDADLTSSEWEALMYRVQLQRFTKIR